MHMHQIYKKPYKRLQIAVRHGSMRLGAYLLRSSTQSAKTDAAPKFDLTSLDHCKVLILRQNQIGDALVSTPVFAALRRHLPNVTLDVLLTRRNASVYDNDTNIRRTYVIKRKPLDIVPVIRLIRAEHYDFVIDLVHSKSSTSTILCLLSRARITIGPARDNDFAYDVVIPHDQQSNERMLLRTAAVLRVFDIDPEKEPLRAYYNLTPEAELFADAIRARALTSGADHPRGSRLIGVNISGSKAEKFWGVQKFIDCLRRLRRSNPDDVFILIYSADYVNEALEISRGTGAELAGTLPGLTHFAAMIAKLDQLITTDSAAVHFADIFNVPMVTLCIDPPSNTLWNPSFVPFETVRSNDFSLASIAVDHVVDAWLALQRKTDSDSPQADRGAINHQPTADVADDVADFTEDGATAKPQAGDSLEWTAAG